MESFLPTYYDANQYIETSAGNKISKVSKIRGPNNIHPSGKVIIKANSIIRGDLAVIKIGKFGIIEEDVVIHSSYTKSKGALKYAAMTIGEHVFIGKASIVCAFKIGNHVEIGENCVISHRCVLKDNCKIMDNSILASDTVVPPFTVFGGRPATFISELPETFPFLAKQKTIQYYRKFIKAKKKA